jgi:hypothetical protein
MRALRIGAAHGWLLPYLCGRDIAKLSSMNTAAEFESCGAKWRIKILSHGALCTRQACSIRWHHVNGLQAFEFNAGADDIDVQSVRVPVEMKRAAYRVYVAFGSAAPRPGRACTYVRIRARVRIGTKPNVNRIRTQLIRILLL